MFLSNELPSCGCIPLPTSAVSVCIHFFHKVTVTFDHWNLISSSLSPMTTGQNVKKCPKGRLEMLCSLGQNIQISSSTSLSVHLWRLWKDCLRKNNLYNTILPFFPLMCGAPGGGGMGMLPSDGVLRWPRVCARGRIAPSDGVRLCPLFMATDTWVGVSDWLGSFLKLSARRSRSGLRAGAGGAAGVLTPAMGVREYSSGSEGRRDLVELQSDREDRERSVTEGEGSKQGSAESWCLDRDRDRFLLGGDVLRRKRPVLWKRPSFFFLCSSLRSCSSWSTWWGHHDTLTNWTTTVLCF